MSTFSTRITSTPSVFDPAKAKYAMLNNLNSAYAGKGKRFCCICSKEKPYLGGKFPAVNSNGKRKTVERFHCGDCLAYRAFDWSI